MRAPAGTGSGSDDGGLLDRRDAVVGVVDRPFGGSGDHVGDRDLTDLEDFDDAAAVHLLRVPAGRPIE